MSIVITRDTGIYKITGIQDIKYYIIEFDNKELLTNYRSTFWVLVLYNCLLNLFKLKKNSIGSRIDIYFRSLTVKNIYL